jgi:hypothetical protein
MYVCAFSFHRESPDMILGDKPLISEVVLSQFPFICYTFTIEGDAKNLII